MFIEFVVHDVFKDEYGTIEPGGVGYGDGVIGVDPGGTGFGVNPDGTGFGVGPGDTGFGVDPDGTGFEGGGFEEGGFLVSPTPKPTPIIIADPNMQETIIAILYCGNIVLSMLLQKTLSNIEFKFDM
jgi:hypothetical protein